VSPVNGHREEKYGKGIDNSGNIAGNIDDFFYRPHRDRADTGRDSLEEDIADDRRIYNG